MKYVFFDGNVMNITRDIFRGFRGSYPNSYTLVGDKMFFVATSIYSAREIYYLANETCAYNDDGSVVIYCNGYCDLSKLTSTTITIIAGDVISNQVLNVPLLIEGNLFSNSLNSQANLTIIGNLIFLGSTFTKNFNSNVSISQCLTISNSTTLQIKFTAQELQQIQNNPGKEYTLLNFNCYSNQFAGYNFVSDNSCESIKGTTNYTGSGLSAVFIVKNVCNASIPNYVWIIIGVVGFCIIATVLILLLIPKTRDIIFPNRRKTRVMRKGRKSSGDTTTSSEKNTKGDI